MSKSLTESAAEILNQTLGKAKDPMQKGPGNADELGGQTPTTEPTAIGVVAAGKQKEAPKPGKSGADSEPMKKLAEDEVESEEEVLEEEQELTEEELDEFLNSLTEEELEQFLADVESDEVVAEEVEEQLPELTEEEIIEARKAKMKGMVDSSMGSCKEDVDALFNGESLSEEFRTKATTIFEAAVRARVEAIATHIAEENEKEVASEIEAIQAQLSEQVDEYLNYVVEQWMKENQVAIETGLRAEIAEDFINGLKNLFAEHYIEVPEEKADLVEEMAGRVIEAEELLEEALGQMETLEKQLNESKSVEILRRTCEGLTEMQVQRIKSLAEGVEFTTEGEYTEKLAVIRESYFPTKASKSEAPVTAVETAESQDVSGVMDYYVKAITKTLPK